jgi:hypothetical protein
MHFDETEAEWTYGLMNTPPPITITLNLLLCGEVLANLIPDVHRQDASRNVGAVQAAANMMICNL